MRILIFTTAYLPFVGGAELAIKEITDRMPDVSFSLITARFRRGVPKFERVGNVEVHRVGFGIPFDKWLLPWLGLRKAEELEHMQSFGTIWSMMASQASIAAARFRKTFPGKKLILTLQEGDEEAHLKRYVFGSNCLYRLLIRPWHIAVFKQADCITAISNYLAERARENNPRAPITVIPNGVNVEAFSGKRLALSREQIRNRLGFAKEDKIVITTSRLVKKNGIEDLIASFQYLPVHVKLLVCGAGPLEDSLRLTANRYPLNARVKFVGYIPHEELPRYLHAADIFVRPSLSEGMGSSFIEAMAASLPVIATPVGGIPDFLFAPLPGSEGEKSLFHNSRELWNIWKEKMTGLFCAAGNAKDIAEKINLLLSNNALRQRIIENAANLVREKYDCDGIAKKMREVFHSIAL